MICIIVVSTLGHYVAGPFKVSISVTLNDIVKASGVDLVDYLTVTVS